MLSRDGHFRTCLCLLLAVVVPFCCCNLHSLLTACEACAPACADRHGHTAAATGPTHHDQGHGDGRGGDSDSKTRHHETPSQGDPQNCTCGKHDAKMLSGEKPTIDLPTAVPVAIHNWIVMPLSAAEPLRAFTNGEVWAFARPPTSLLRMHCALIV